VSVTDKSMSEGHWWSDTE